MAHLGQALLGGLLAGAVLVAGVVLAAGWAFRRARRRTRVAGRAVQLGLSAMAGLSARGLRWAGAQPWTTVHYWRAERTRRRLWLAVADAERAVHAAAAAQAPVGDLPGLCKQLRRTAGQVDGSLRLWGRAPTAPGLPPAVSRQLAQLTEAADQIHASATAAMVRATAPSLRALVTDCRSESEALAAGLDRLGSM